MYYLTRIIQKLQPIAKRNSIVHEKAKLEGGTQFINSSIGKYSFCGYNCKIINAKIGAFCSIASNVKIGLAGHPINWVSTSCAFYKGRDSIKKDLASLEYQERYSTSIGNDVWIAEGVYIKPGLSISDGAIIGMGSVLTKDVGPYEIWAGNPAKLIKKRFDEELINDLLQIQWWKFKESELKKYSHLFNNPRLLIKELYKKDSEKII